MSWVNPKLDWTKDDYFNAEDFNRIEANTQFVHDYLYNMQYDISLSGINIGRDSTSIDFISSINRIEENIESLKSGFLTPPGWQNTETWLLGKSFDYTDANRLESNLNLLYEYAKLAKDCLIYSGTFNCGTDWEGELYA